MNLSGNFPMIRHEPLTPYLCFSSFLTRFDENETCLRKQSSLLMYTALYASLFTISCCSVFEDVNRSGTFVSFGVTLKRKFKIMGFKAKVQPLGHPLDFLQNSQGCSNNKWRRVVVQIAGLVFSKVNWTKFRWHFILTSTGECQTLVIFGPLFILKK